MQIKNFQDLVVWQKSHQLTLKIYKLSKNFPPDEKYGLSIQIRRSASSVAANIAEGFKRSKGDYSRYLEISRGSLEETKYHLILSNDLNYCSKEIFTRLFADCEEIGKMLNGLAVKVRQF